MGTICKFLGLGGELYGFKELHDNIIGIGYNYMSYRNKSRPDAGSRCYKLNEYNVTDYSEKIEIISIYETKKSKLSEDKTVVVKTNEGFFEYFKM